MRIRDENFINQANGVIEPIIGSGVLMLTAVISLVIGIIFVVAGYYGKQRWIVFWGGGQVIVSFIYIAYMIFY